MDVFELLERIRALNIGALSAAIASAGRVHVEPALRRSDGALAVEGRWRMPVRLDFLRKGNESERTDPVSPTRTLSFSRFTTTLGNAEVDVGPFGWDWCEIVTDLTPEAVGPPLQQWFTEWFDPDDENPRRPDGLYGVVHFASDPEPSGLGSRFVVDLGSAPAACLESLFSRLSAEGMRIGRIG
jgi:hypothetical protein